MREILNDIYVWCRLSERHGYNFNGHIIHHPDGNLCIDPVDPSTEDMTEIAQLGVERILLTNRNHSRAANQVRENTGARTAIHAEDAGHAGEQGTEIDSALRVGEKIGPLDVIGVPGKSPGEVAFHWLDRRLLIVGDAVIGHPAGSCGLLSEKVLDDPGRLRASVRALLDYDFDVLLVGDGESILTAGKDRLRELVDTFPT